MGDSPGYTLFIPREWHALPTDEAGAEAIVDTFEVLPDTGQRLVLGLLGARAYVQSRTNPNRHAWGLIATPGSGRVDAVLTLGFRQVSPGSVELYVRTAHEMPPEINGMEIIKHTVREVDIPSGRVILTTDFVLDPPGESGQRSVLERAIALLVPADGSVAFEFSMVTHDLAVFHDSGEYLLAVVSETIVEPAGVAS